MTLSARRDFRTFIGVDLGGGKGKKTAVALLQVAQDDVRVSFVGLKSPTGDPFYDSQLLNFVLQHKEKAVLAIDAPLTLTSCVRCRLPVCPGHEGCVDPVVSWFRGPGCELVLGEGRPNGKPPTTPYTQRACEVLLHRRYGVQPRETLGQGMGPLTARAHYLRRVLERQGFELNQNLIEVYPKATVHMLFDADRARRYKRQVNTWQTRAQMLEALSDHLRFEVWREGCLNNDHCFDALLCAYTAYLWSVECWTLPEHHSEVFAQDGWIWFPPPSDSD